MRQSRFSITNSIIAANAIVFALELVLGDTFTLSLALWPIGAGFMPWQLLTHAFVHANPTHLLFNMFGLWMFGRAIETELGGRAVFEIYFASILMAGATQLLVSTLSGGIYPSLGASGGVFGLLLAYGMYFPRRIIVLLIPPIPMPAWLFVTLYAVIELIMGVTGTEAGIAHFAHLGGMVGAYLLVRYRHIHPR
jgi:membrane associated rhomboid family serine protease